MSDINENLPSEDYVAGFKAATQEYNALLIHAMGECTTDREAVGRLGGIILGTELILNGGSVAEAHMVSDIFEELGK
jgi:hypothetical protein